MVTWRLTCTQRIARQSGRLGFCPWGPGNHLERPATRLGYLGSQPKCFISMAFWRNGPAGRRKAYRCLILLNWRFCGRIIAHLPSGTAHRQWLKATGYLRLASGTAPATKLGLSVGLNIGQKAGGGWLRPPWKIPVPWGHCVNSTVCKGWIGAACWSCAV